MKELYAFISFVIFFILNTMGLNIQNHSIHFFCKVCAVICISFLLLSHSRIYAQPSPISQKIDKFEILDNVSYVVTYNLTFVKDPQKLKKGHDQIVLELGKKFSKSYSQVLFSADSTATEWLRRGAEAVPFPKEWVPLEDVYKNYSTKRSKIVFRSIFSGPVYHYEEDTDLMKWTLQPEKRQILSYSCQRATTSFAGRNYEAWFTYDIPMPNGPWKFGGLPGLILSLRETRDHFVFECVAVQKPKQERQIKHWLWKYEPITRRQLLKLKKTMYLNTYNYCISIGQDIAGDPTEAKNKLTFTYNPIELE
ncbi:GLPGLI family protein [Porphyromonas cangingivalis]|nr:GLPGLI family protein [Porphyromonas cangingivalis]